MGRPKAWSGPTRAIRVPEALADHLLTIAKELDNPQPDNVQNPNGLPICKPKADGETIAQGLAEGWIVPKAQPRVTFPDREFEIEWGDRITGKDPKGKTHTGIVSKLGIKYAKLLDSTGITGIDLATAVVVTRREDVQIRPCPFTVGDLLSWNGETWMVESVELTQLLTWKFALIEPDARPGEWSVKSLEWPCDEDCPATAVKSGSPPLLGEMPRPPMKMLTSESSGGTYRLFLDPPRDLPPQAAQAVEEYCDRVFAGLTESERCFLLARLVEQLGEKVDA
jgi:hypothetical protein